MASMTTSISSNSLSDEIDQLLEQYLGLLHQYTTLRDQLSLGQSSIHQKIARANFTADRGIRYGQDNYDERIQATRTCCVTAGSKSDNPDASMPVFKVSLAYKTLEKETEYQKDGTSDQPEYKVKDPIRMFGILVPQALRAAQSDSIRMVEGVIPRLVSIDAEMREIEIQIRRKRKHRAKAEVSELRADAGGQKTTNEIICGD